MDAASPSPSSSRPAPRADGRPLGTSLRPLASDQALLNRADGSACFAQGATVVLAAVYGPVQTFGGGGGGGGKASGAGIAQDAERLGAVEVTYKPPDGSAGTGMASKENQVVLAATLSHVITLAAYPQTAIRFTVQVLDDCGSALAAAVNACGLALVDAGVAQKGMAVAVCCAVMPGGVILLDPTTDEEVSAVALMTTVWHSVSREMLACRTSGVMNRAEFARCRSASREAISMVLAFMRMSFVAKCRQQYDDLSIQDINEYMRELPAE
jgi:exosome complex component RRP46